MRVGSRVLGLAVAIASSVGISGCFLSHEAPAADPPEVTPPSSTDIDPGRGPGDLAPRPPPDNSDPVGPPRSDPPPPPDPPPPSEPPPPDGPLALVDEPVLIEAEPGLLFMPAHQILGDMDGDGVDDFVLFAIDALQFQVIAPSLPSYAFVFYGRSDLPSRLTTADADAVLRHDGPPLSPNLMSQALGDVNADGLADLVLASVNTVHFLFGSTQRLSGEIELTDVASATWTVGTADPSAYPPFVQGTIPTPAGDVDGDGIADFVMSFANTVYEPSGAAGPRFETYLFRGQAGPWPSGDFDPAWATAELTVPNATRGCSFITGADFDGDGYSDLVVNAEDVMMRFVPGAQTLEGTVNVMEDGLPFVALYPRVWQLPDLDGDGSDEIAWRDTAGRAGVFVTYGGALDWPLSLVPDAALGSVDESVGAFDSADVDGDGMTDLILATSGVGSASSPPPGGLYVVPGGDARLSGEITLDGRYLLIAGGNEDGEGLVMGSFGSSLDASGDVTGDGIADILATITASDDSVPFPSTRVLLVPGGLERTPSNR